MTTSSPSPMPSYRGRRLVLYELLQQRIITTFTNLPFTAAAAAAAVRKWLQFGSGAQHAFMLCWAAAGAGTARSQQSRLIYTVYAFCNNYLGIPYSLPEEEYHRNKMAY